MSRVQVEPKAPGENALNKMLVASILLCLALQVWLALVMEINWDEFYFLSQVYDYQRGELATALQTLHVHLFGWLTAIGGDEIRQVIVGRFFMLACESATCALVYALCRTFFGRPASLFATLAYVSAGFTIIYGASFRTDPLAAMLIIASLAIVARGLISLPAAIGSALCAAVAAMVTVKVIFYAPAFAAIAAYRWRTSAEPRRALAWLALAGALALIFFGALYLLHLNSLERGSLSATRSMLGGAASTTIVEAGLFSQGSEIVRSAILAPVKTVLLITALVSIVVTASRNKEERLELLVLLSCAAPLLSLVIYRNAFPYFFPFIVPPGMLLVGWLGDRQAWPRLGLPIAASLMVAWAVFVAFLWSSHGQMVQRQTIAAVHRMFPQPVVYIDRSGMIASFPRRGFFMSTWGMLNYHEGPPIFSEILSRETVPLLIISGPALNESAGLIAGVPDQLRLYPQDEKVLQQNYIQHWGRIWVAGKRLDANPEPSTFRVMIPGRYTVEGAPASIDGRALPPGATVDLERGLHSVKSATPQILTLRWGNHLYRPANAPLPGPMYRGF